MKKQVITVAALMIASNVAMADVSQMSGDSVKSIVQAGAVLSAGTVQFAKDGVGLSAQAFNGALRIGAASAAGTVAVGTAVVGATVGAVASTAKGVSQVAGKVGDATIASAKSTSQNASDAASFVKDKTVASARSTAEGISQAAEFTVETVKSTAAKTSRVIEVTLKSVADGTKYTLTFSYNSTTAIGKDMIVSAGALLQLGKTVVVATSNAGVVIVTDSANGVGAVLDGDIKAGSSTIIASVSNSSKAFGSNMVQGMQRK